MLTGMAAVDLRMRTLDGRERYVSVSASPIRDQAGRITGAVSIVRDRTDRRQMEEHARASLGALLAMAEALVAGTNVALEEPAVVPVLTPAGAATWPSPLTAADRMARRLVELVCRLLTCQRAAIILLDPATGTIRSVALAGESLEYEHTLMALVRGVPLSQLTGDAMADRLSASDVVTVDLSHLPFQGLSYATPAALVAPMRIGDQLIGVLGMDRHAPGGVGDAEEYALVGTAARMVAMVIERERLLAEREVTRASELALLEANRRMDTFLSMASHELKTPLVGADLSVQALASKLDRLRALRLPAAARAQTTALSELLTRAKHQMRRANRLVEDLLDVTRIERGGIKMTCVSCALHPILSAAVEEACATHRERAIHLELGAVEPMEIVADADRIGQVVTNYLNNALRYSAAERPITVQLTRVDGMAHVAVRDEGQGIPLGEQGRIWERFTQAEGVTKQAESGIGMGLGLYISRAIIERHGGQVGVESAPGQGSAFWFTLPLANL
ncbi:MAG: GAF domain-containing protein [Ktedonobacterales bacterium]|nr:GAF domain-containing protein [Ktedonobacterales bacterium]